MRLTVSGDAGTRTERRTASLPAPIGAITIAVLLAVVAWLDYTTGTAPIQHLYYLPIILAAFVFDYWGGLTCALVAKVDEEFFGAGEECEGCEQEFFPAGHVKSNFLCNLGYGDESKLFPKGPRLEFNEACTLL